MPLYVTHLVFPKIVQGLQRRELCG